MAALSARFLLPMHRARDRQTAGSAGASTRPHQLADRMAHQPWQRDDPAAVLRAPCRIDL